MKYFCNPLNINYRYQFYEERHPDGRPKIGWEYYVRGDAFNENGITHGEMEALCLGREK